MILQNLNSPVMINLANKVGTAKKKKDENDRIYNGVVQKNYTTRLKFNGSNEK